MARELQFQVRVRRSTVMAAIGGAAASLAVVASLAFAAPAEICARGLFCFAADEPALAGQVNGNFAAVAVGLGTIISHTTHLMGSETVAELQARGFALCDGTTPASQGITGAIITAATPNLNQGRFLRGGGTAQSGALEDDATAVNGLTLTDPGHDHVTMTSDNCNNFNGNFSLGVYTFRNVALSGAKRFQAWDTNQNCNSGHYTTGGAATGISFNVAGSDAETRPTNMRVVWLMRVR